jgi:MraZ protein
MFTSRVDDKGRLKLPEEIKRHLAEVEWTELFITSFEGRVARIYSVQSWQRAEALLEQSGEHALRGQQLLFQAQRYGTDSAVDGQGRVLISPVLRRKMQVENQPVYLAFFRDHLEVYSEAVFEEKAEQADAGTEEKVNVFVELGLP